MYAGGAYVFVRNGSTWTQQAFLKASNTQAGDFFGGSVAISDDSLVVGASLEDSFANGINGDQTSNLGVSSGAAYVFVRNGTSWSQQAYLKASNTGKGDNFGQAVGISDSTIVVGADNEDSDATGIDGDQTSNIGSNSGAAYVFVRSGSNWTQQAYLKASNAETLDAFGRAVAISDNTVIVGAWSEDSQATGVNGDQMDNSARRSGAAYIFVRSELGWSQQAYLKASNTGGVPIGAPINPGDLFGGSVAIAGNRVIVGAHTEDSNATQVNGDGSDNAAIESGAAYLFRVRRSLTGGVSPLSLSAGGQSTLTLDAGAGRAGWFYWVLGSATGTTPGLDLGDGHVLSLQFDRYFTSTLKNRDAGVFRNLAGRLDELCGAIATLQLPLESNPTLAGLTLHHAFYAAEELGAVDYVSNAVSVKLAP